MMNSEMFKKAPIAGRFDGKVVIVTGGTAGIGEGIVRRFHAEGATVVFTGRNAERGEALVAELCKARPASAEFLSCDHSIGSECHRCVEHVVSVRKRVDVLVNNAGVVTLGPLEETDDAAYASVMRTNTDSVWHMCRAALPVMAQQEGGGGVVINIASDWGLVGAPDAAAYCASKAAVVMLTKCLALEYAKRGVRVCAVCPGNTFVARWMREARESGEWPRGEYSDEVLEDALRTDCELPMGRVADVQEVAGAVVFLAGPDASYMTGCAIPVDGGESAK